MEKIMPCCSQENGVSEVPIEGKWVEIHEIQHISGLSHGIGKCPPQQGACKLTLNVKCGKIDEALIETVGCSGMTQSATIASELLVGKNIVEALNTHLACDAINSAMKEIFLQLLYGRTQTAFSDNGLCDGCSFDLLAKSGRSFVGTAVAGKNFGARPLETAEGYILELALDKHKKIIGYKYFDTNSFLENFNSDTSKDKYIKNYGRYHEGVFFINPREK